MSKLSQDLLSELFFDDKIEDPSVILGPKYGEDAAVLEIGDTNLVIHTDPISGAVENIGWLSINIAANDIAVTGARPRWALCSIQVPKDMSHRQLKGTAEGLKQAADELDVTIIGGHTEYISGINRPLISITMMGLTDEPIYTSGSKVGDKIIQIKPAGIEGSWILVNDFEEKLIEKGIDKQLIDEVKGWRNKISVVRPALEIKDIATSIHDPTEGGILQGLYEMASCSGNDFYIDSEFEIKSETRAICEVLDIDPFYLISSGCLLATVPKGIDSTQGKVIGEVRKGKGKLLYGDKVIKENSKDELFRIIDEWET